MDPLDVLPVVKTVAGMRDAYHVTTIKGYREDKDGRTREVTVEIMDRGRGPSPRYYIRAEDELGRPASGNGADDLQVTLAIVHWHDLDKDPPTKSG